MLSERYTVHRHWRVYPCVRVGLKVNGPLDTFSIRKQIRRPVDYKFMQIFWFYSSLNNTGPLCYPAQRRGVWSVWWTDSRIMNNWGPQQQVERITMHSGNLATLEILGISIHIFTIHTPTTQAQCWPFSLTMMPLLSKRSILSIRSQTDVYL